MRRIANVAEKTAVAESKTAVAAAETVKAAMSKADAAWELVIITRNQVNRRFSLSKETLVEEVVWNLLFRR